MESDKLFAPIWKIEPKRPPIGLDVHVLIETLWKQPELQGRNGFVVNFGAKAREMELVNSLMLKPMKEIDAMCVQPLDEVGLFSCLPCEFSGNLRNSDWAIPAEMEVLAKDYYPHLVNGAKISEVMSRLVGSKLIRAELNSEDLTILQHPRGGTIPSPYTHTLRKKDGLVDWLEGEPYNTDIFINYGFGLGGFRMRGAGACTAVTVLCGGIQVIVCVEKKSEDQFRELMRTTFIRNRKNKPASLCPAVTAFTSIAVTPELLGQHDIDYYLLVLYPGDTAIIGPNTWCMTVTVPVPGQPLTVTEISTILRTGVELNTAGFEDFSKKYACACPDEVERPCCGYEEADEEDHNRYRFSADRFQMALTYDDPTTVYTSGRDLYCVFKKRTVGCLGIAPEGSLPPSLDATLLDSVKCLYCAMKFDDEESQIKHMKKCHTKRYTMDERGHKDLRCRYCGYKSDRVFSAWRHLEPTRPSALVGEFSCNDCENEYSYSCALKHHNEIVHGRVPEPNLDGMDVDP